LIERTRWDENPESGGGTPVELGYPANASRIEMANESGGPSSPLPVTRLNQIIRGNRITEYESPALVLGMRPTGFEQGLSRWSWSAQPPLVLNPFGMIGGGFIAVLVDELCSTAIASVLEEAEWAVTVETKISYLRLLRPGPVNGVGRVLRRGRTLALLEAQVTTADGTVAALASSTWSISR
jgi:uncharacterized protein (TIGR00369 family)